MVKTFYDKDGYEIQFRRVIYYTEIGYCDQYGKWMRTVESHKFPTIAEALELRDKWIEERKIIELSWGGYRANFSYGDFRIRREEEKCDVIFT